MNYSKLASYRGSEEASIYAYAAVELREDRARLHLFEFLQKTSRSHKPRLVKYWTPRMEDSRYFIPR